ncbi:MAG: hypothetical protein VB013_11395 [Anaerolineaceae bacterium]|nr:hypothetical protein [Anaerolineaceae bacterium]
MKKKLTFVCLMIAILVILVNSCSVENPEQAVKETVAPVVPTKVQNTINPTVVPTPTISPTAIAPDLFDKPMLPITSENAADITELHRFGDGTYNDSLFTSDGKYLLVLTSVGLFFYDAKTFEQIDLLNLGLSGYKIAVNKDNTVLVAVGVSDQIAVIRLSDRKIINRITIEGAWGSIMCPFLSPDGNQVGVFVDLSDRGHQETFIGFYSTYNGNYLYRIDVTLNPSSYINSFSPDGYKIVMRRGESLEIWDFSSGKLIKQVPASNEIQKCSFSPNGELILCRDWGGHYEMFYAGDLSPYIVNFASQENFLEIGFSADGTTLWGCREDNTVVNLDLKDGTIKHSIKIDQEIKECQISPDGQKVAIASDGIIQSVFRLADGKLLAEIGDYSPTYEISGFLLPGSQNFVYSYGGEAKNFNLLTGKYSVWSRVKDQGVDNLLISPDGQYFAYDTDKRIVAEKILDGSEKKTLSTLGEKVFSKDNQLLAVSKEFTIDIWNLAKNQVMLTLPGHSDRVSALAFSSDDKYLASGSWDDTIKIWRLSDGTMVRTFFDHKDSITEIRFLPDGKTIVSGSGNGPLIEWNYLTGELLNSSDVDGIISMDISPDNSLIATASYDGTISISRVSDLYLVKKLEGHAKDVDFVHFASDGTMLISAAEDGSIRVWGIR